MRLISRSFFSIGTGLIISGLCHAQKFVPHTFMAGLDIPGIVRNFASPNRNMGELQLSTNLASHMLLFEYGLENINRENTDFLYKTRGTYFRAGMDFTLNPKNPQGHKIFTGFRYAQSNFKNSLDYRFESEVYNNPQLSTSNDNLKGLWPEWTFGMKLMLKANLVMGYTIRYKFRPKIKGVDMLKPFDLPGYGKVKKGTNFGLSYYLLYSIKFRKVKEVAKAARP